MEHQPRVIDGGVTAKSEPAVAGNTPAPVRGPLVEDATLVGGVDAEGRAVIAPKTPEGRADESVTPTDPREA